MSKAYPSNLTRAQYEFLSDMIPEPKPGGGKRCVDMWEVMNAIFASPARRSEMASVAGVTFRPGRQCTHISAIGAHVGTWLHIHDSLREWTRIEIERHPSPSEAIIDSQSVAVCRDGESIRGL